jgi:hypothetical protein
VNHKQVSTTLLYSSLKKSSPFFPRVPITMIAISCAILAAPLMAAALAVSPPVGVFGALLIPSFYPKGSRLHARQESSNFFVPEECFPICDPTLARVNVSTFLARVLFANCRVLNHHRTFRRVAPMHNVSARMRTRTRSPIAYIAPWRGSRQPPRLHRPKMR